MKTFRYVLMAAVSSFVLIAASQLAAVGQTGDENDPYGSADSPSGSDPGRQIVPPNTPCGRISFALYTNVQANHFLDAGLESDLIPEFLVTNQVFDPPLEMSNWNCLSDDLADRVTAIFQTFNKPGAQLTLGTAGTTEMALDDWVATWLMWTPLGNNQDWRGYLTELHEGRPMLFKEFRTDPDNGPNGILAYNPRYVQLTSQLLTTADSGISSWEETRRQICESGLSAGC